MAKSVIDYYETATVTCSNCNSVYTMGMTVEKLDVEICGNCHPFYTGQETLIDTAGRIEKFQARLAKSGDTSKKKKKTKSRKSVQTLADLNAGNEDTKPEKKEKKTKDATEKVENGGSTAVKDEATTPAPAEQPKDQEAPQEKTEKSETPKEEK